MRLHVEDSSKTKGEFENVDKVEMVIELILIKCPQLSYFL